MAALAPIPSASVTTTVMASPLPRDSDRNATRKSVRMFICPCRLADAEIDIREADDRLPYLGLRGEHGTSDALDDSGSGILRGVDGGGAAARRRRPGARRRARAGDAAPDHDDHGVGG